MLDSETLKIIKNLSRGQQKELYIYLEKELFDCKDIGLRCEELVARLVNGQLGKTTQKGYDVLGSDGLRYQVKKKELFNTNRTRNKGGYIKFTNLEFDVLIVVATTIKPYYDLVKCRSWDVEYVKKHLTPGGYFNISTKARFETGELVDLKELTLD